MQVLRLALWGEHLGLNESEVRATTSMLCHLSRRKACFFYLCDSGDEKWTHSLRIVPCAEQLEAKSEVESEVVLFMVLHLLLLFYLMGDIKSGCIFQNWHCGLAI
jgi:hypothetical protein